MDKSLLKCGGGEALRHCSGLSLAHSVAEDPTWSRHQATLPGTPNCLKAHPKPAILLEPLRLGEGSRGREGNTFSLLQEFKESVKCSHCLPGEPEGPGITTPERECSPVLSGQIRPGIQRNKSPPPACKAAEVRSSPKEVGPPGKCGLKTKTTLYEHRGQTGKYVRQGTQRRRSRSLTPSRPRRSEAEEVPAWTRGRASGR